MAEGAQTEGKMSFLPWLSHFLSGKDKALFFIQAKYFVIIPLDKGITDVFFSGRNFCYKAHWVIRASGYVWASNGPISPSGS